MRAAFYLGNDKDQLENLKQHCRRLWPQIAVFESSPFHLITPENEMTSCVFQNEHYIGFVSGWIRHLDLNSVNYDDLQSFEPHLERFFNTIFTDVWPILDDKYTGCFSGILFDKTDHNLKLFNDAIGMYPIYFRIDRFSITGSTNIAVLSRALRCSIDLAGVLQTITGPEYSNYGRRTIVTGVQRLLPGELMCFSSPSAAHSKYDNSLYQDDSETNPSLEILSSTIWQCVKEDIRACIGETPKVNVCMSGGWDSRLMISALADHHKLQFFTWATSEDAYEVTLARKCAEIVDAHFDYCDLKEHWFPTDVELRRNVLYTASAYNPAPFSVLVRARPDFPKEVIIMGDMYEAIVGRNLKTLTSRDARKRNYIRRLTGRKIGLAPANQEVFESWARALEVSLLKQQLTGLTLLKEEVASGIDESEFRHELQKDIADLVKRIGDHDISYAASYQELFGWYTHGRTNMARQILMLGERFFSLGPTMSFRSLREISNINPLIRANGYLLDAILRLPELRPLAKLPSANIPFVPSHYPRIVKDAVWGGRFLIDSLLTKRVLSRRTQSTRRRLLKSDDLIRLYRSPVSQTRADSWFSDQIIRKEPFIERIQKRASLEEHPLVNFDIVGAANTSILVDFIMEGSH